MEPRPRQPAPGAATPAKDLDNTDQLPVLDPQAYEAAQRERREEGTWVMPVPGLQPAAEPRTPPDDPLQTAVDNLHEAQELLARRAERLAQLERSLEDAHAAHAAAERRAAQLGDEFAQARANTEQRAAALQEELAQAHAAAERREAEHAEGLARAHAGAEQRAGALGEELTQARSAAGEREAQLNRELAEARAAAARRESEFAAQLAQAQAAAEGRVQEERAAAAQAQRAREAESRQALGVREQAHVALQSELRALHTRATGYFELLQSAERRRSLLEGLVSDLQDETETHENSRARLARELAGRDTRAGELESQLNERSARGASLEQQVHSLTATIAERDREVTRLTAARAGLEAALEAARAATAAASARATEQETGFGQARTRLAGLEAELAAERRQHAGRDQELAKVRGEMEEWAGALRVAQLERSTQLANISAGETRVRELEARVTEQAETLRSLQTASEAAIARTRELESDMRAAEDTIARLEGQLRGRNARVSELEKANQQWRNTLEEARAALHETGSHRVLREGAHAAAAGAADGPEPAPDGATRLLIHSDGEREVVHVLGRKTSIGRTPDNDLQIDAKYISRHHAVILAGPAHTIVEDLNSTNGVLVNGRRITRETLKDGDSVVIGRTQYRFAVRRTGEKR